MNFASLASLRIGAASVAIIMGALVACGGSSAAPPSIASCVPGAQTECACPGGDPGVQVCTPQGTYGACDCSGEERASSEPSTPSKPKKPAPPEDDDEWPEPEPEPEPEPGLPPPSGKAAACAGTGNVLVLDGDSGDYIHPGYVKITNATKWQAQQSAANDTIALNIDPASPQQGLWWHVDLASTKGSNLPLAPGAYLNAERSAFRAVGRSGIDIGGDGRGCNTITGKFWIEEITWDGPWLKHLLAAFEQHCEGASPALRGCIRYDAP